jgi:hypothetical protein
MKEGLYIVMSKSHACTASRTQVQHTIKQLIKSELRDDMSDSNREIIILKPSKIDIIKSNSNIKYNNSDVLKVIKF